MVVVKDILHVAQLDRANKGLSLVTPKESSKLSALNIGKEAKRFDSSTGLHKPWKTIKKGEYLYAKIPNHPNATKNGYVLEHRAVMENFLGRYLEVSEVVHHINNHKHDNRIENLRLMSRKDHGWLHKPPLKTEERICPNCGRSFIRKPKGKADTGVSPKCSRKCNGEYSRKIQMGLL